MALHIILGLRVYWASERPATRDGTGLMLFIPVWCCLGCGGTRPGGSVWDVGVLMLFGLWGLDVVWVVGEHVRVGGLVGRSRILCIESLDWLTWRLLELILLEGRTESLSQNLLRRLLEPLKCNGSH